MKKSVLALSLSFLFMPFLQVAQATFTDVSETHPNYEAINYVQTQGIVKGYTDGTYKPEQLVNRAEMVKIVTEAVFAEKSRTGDCVNFPDVEAGDWFMPYVCFGQNEGIIAGYGDGSFKPGNTINFAEASKIIAKAFGWNNLATSEIWFKPFVDQLASVRAIPASVNAFNHLLTRGEMAEIIYRVHAQNDTKISHTYTTIENETLLVEPTVNNEPLLQPEDPEGATTLTSDIEGEKSDTEDTALIDDDPALSIEDEPTTITNGSDTNTTLSSPSPGASVDNPAFDIPEPESPSQDEPEPELEETVSPSYWMTTENGILTENRSNGLQIQLTDGKIKIIDTNNAKTYFYVGYETKSNGTEIFANYWGTTNQQTESLIILPSGEYRTQTYGISIDTDGPPAVIQGYTFPSQ